MATLTLTRMAEGGIYDQLGGGFSRYSVDPYWMIPHFEKMLYDNGQLLAVVAQAALATADPLVPARRRRDRGLDAPRPASTRTAASTRRSTPIPKATKAASTSGTARSVRGLLPADEYEVFALRFGLDRAAELRGPVASALASCPTAARRRAQRAAR